MAKNVTTIPASISRFTAAPMQQKTKRRVAAYARVSTDRDEQLTSYEAQVAYYTDYINSRSDWEFAGIYSDSGITGCNTKKRIGFNQMIEDALAGKFSLIITKSVSRFARNTVDSLTNIRKLKEHGVECYFEKENIWTFDSKGELLLTIMSSIAQEESRSISENCTWGQRRRFEEGKVSVPFKRFLGYDKGKDGELVVNQEQAKIVRRIYAEFLKGRSPYQIAKDLTADEIPTPGGKAKWTGGVIRSILQNEKYKGDALLQKVFTPDYLTKKKIKNEGQVPQYYVRGDHEAIIEPEVFELVQRQIKQRKSGSRSNVSIFSGKLICADCGGYYGLKVWHSNDKYRKVIWQCNHKFQGKKCTTPTLSETEIKELLIRALNKLITCKSEIIASYEDIKGTIFSTEMLEQELAEITDKMKKTNEKMAELITQNASFAVDQAEYDKKYAKLTKLYDSLLMRRNNVIAEITEKQEKEKDMHRFLERLKTLDAMTEFEDEIWVLLLESVTIHSQGNADFKFVDGTVISIEHENH